MRFALDSQRFHIGYVCLHWKKWLDASAEPESYPIPKMPWNLPLLIMGELHITILQNMTAALLPVNKDIQDFSFSEGSLITSHSEKRFSELPCFQETSYILCLLKFS